MGFDTEVLGGSVLAGEEAIQWMLREYCDRSKPVKVAWLAWGSASFEAVCAA